MQRGSEICTQTCVRAQLLAYWSRPQHCPLTLTPPLPLNPFFFTLNPSTLYRPEGSRHSWLSLPKKLSAGGSTERSVDISYIVSSARKIA